MSETKKRSNGEGNVRERKDGRWEGMYSAGVNPETGKYIRKSVFAKTKEECEKKVERNHYDNKYWRLLESFKTIYDFLNERR